MKLSIRYLLLFCIVFSEISWAKGQEVILLCPIENDKSVGSIEQLLPEKHQNSQLVGCVRKSPTPDQKEYLFQIAWTGLQDKTDKTKQIAFEKPMVSTFKTRQKSLKKGQSLPIMGDVEQLLKATQQLETEKTDVQALKRKQFAKNPSATGRSVEVETTIDLHPNALADAQQNRVNTTPQFQEGLTHQSGLIRDTGLHMTQDLNNATLDVNAAQKSPGAGLNRDARHYFANNAEVPGVQQGTPDAPHVNRNMNHPNARENGVPIGRNRGANRDAGFPDLNAAGFNPPNVNNGNPLGDNPLAFDAAPEREAEPEGPEISYESTTEGCYPTIDRPHERVVIQNRTLKRENGAIVEESACADSLEMYPINKDFLCEGCTDQVEIPRQRAYARFKEYWLDKENQRQNLSDTLYVELTRPYVFSEESGYCLPSINLQRGIAHRQVETVYYNLFNARTVVEACHTTPHHAPVLINETTHLCPMVHDFANNVSREQKRSIFTLDGIEREALACHPVDPTFPHEFVRTGCRPLVAANGAFIDMVKRKIRTPTGSKIISEECEPAANNALQTTRDGCEGEFFHDLIAGFSYLKKRYYYPHGANREYMTGCLRTTESLAHQTELNGYQHDDQNLHSTPRFLVYIESPEQGRLIVDPAKVIVALGQTNYTLLRNEHRPTSEQYYEGCYRRTKTQSINIYTRADGTLYERLIGDGNPMASPVDECIRTTESQQVVTGHGGGNFWRHGRARYGTQHRTKITYPNGTVEYTQWQ